MSIRELRILLPLDGSADAESVLAAVLPLAQRCPLRLTLLSVDPQAAALRVLRLQALAAARRELLAHEHIHLHRLVAVGDAAAADEAEDERCVLVDERPPALRRVASDQRAKRVVCQLWTGVKRWRSPLPPAENRFAASTRLVRNLTVACAPDRSRSTRCGANPMVDAI